MFIANDWKPERSSGYDGWRNTKTGEWIYDADYQRRNKLIVEDKLACGGCGCTIHTLILLREHDQPRLGGEGSGGTGIALRTTCTQCKAVTEITLSNPGFVTESKSEDGSSICGGWMGEGQ